MVRDLPGTDGAEVSDLPGALSPLELCPKEGGREEIEELAAQALILLCHILPEIDAQGEGVGQQAGEVLLNQLLQIIGEDPHEGWVLQILDGGHVWKGTVAPSFRQEGHVVADTLIPVGSADIEDFETTALTPRRIREVGPSQHDLGAWNLQGPILGALHHQNACH